MINQIGSSSDSNWFVRVYARNAFTSTNRLIQIPAQTNSPFSHANFYNVDDQTYTFNTALLTNLKIVVHVNDPFSGAANPRHISGGVAQYTIVITDPTPDNTTLFTGNLSAGAQYIFTNDIPISLLNCPFIALNRIIDCVDSSNNGGAN